MKKIITLLLLLTMFVSCEKGGEKGVETTLTLSKKQVAIYHNDKVNIGAYTTGDGLITYQTSDENVAIVSLDGEVTGGIIGKTEILVSDGVNSGKCNVEVKQKYEYIKEPYLKFGVSVSELRNEVSDRYMFGGGGGPAVYQIEDGIFSYKRIYMFKDNKYYAVETQYDSNSTVLMETIGAISERYVKKGVVGSSIFYGDKEGVFTARVSSEGFSNIPLKNTTYVLYTVN